jgi:riboflavin kinase/FMN adenylyltransferase
MKIHHSLEGIKGIKNPVVTTGSFDGVHVGHRVIIRRLNKLAEDISGESVLITFHPHPRRVLYPDTEGKDMLLICSQKEKIKLLEETGLDHLVIVNFTKEFAAKTSDQFIEEIIVNLLKAHTVVVGFNHHFGSNRRGDFGYLYKMSRIHGFDVEEIPEQDIQNESVSSTKIRKALLEGNIQRANAYLDHYYMIMGEAHRNMERSEEFGIDIMNLKIDEDIKLIPPDGVYAVQIKSGSRFSKAMLSVKGMGIQNGLLSKDLKVEFYVLENSFSFDTEIYFYFHK